MYQTTYHRPSSVDEAASLFAKGSESKYLAGGHTLIPVMKQRLASPSGVIDLGKIKEFAGIEPPADPRGEGAAGLAVRRDRSRQDQGTRRHRSIRRRADDQGGYDLFRHHAK